MANTKKTLELAFAIGGALSPSFKTANSQAAAEIEKLSKKSNDAMKLGKLSKEYDDAVKNFTGAADKMGAAWGKVVDSVVGPLKQIITVGALAGTAVYGLAYKTAKMGDDAVKGAAKIGVTTQQFSEMSYAATQSGLSAEQFAGTMGKLNSVIQQQVIKGKTDLFINGKRILNLRDENKRVKDRTRLLLESADAFKKLTDENEKHTLATLMFGKAGTEMIPMLEQGSAGIQKLMGDAQRLGVVFDDISGQKAVAFMSSWGELKAAAQGLAIAVGQQLHEPLTRVNNAVVGWITTNRELIGQKVNEFIQDIIKWLKENKDGIIGLKDSVVEFIHNIGKWIEKNGGLVEVLKKVGKAFLALKAIGIAFSLMGAVAATASFVASMIALGIQIAAIVAKLGGIKAVIGLIGGLSLPVLAVVAAVAALGVAAYMLIKHWDGVVYFFKNLTTTVPIFFSDLFDDIIGVFGRLPGWLQGIMAPIKNIVLGPIQAIQALISGDIRGFFAGIGKFIFSSLFTIPQMIIGAGNEIVKAIFGIDIIGAVKAWISPAVDAIWSILDTGIGAIADFFVKEFNNIKDAFGSGFLNGIFELVVSVPTMFIRMGADVVKAILGMDIVSAGIKRVGEFISAVGNAIKSFFSGELAAVKDAFGNGFFRGIGEIVSRIPTLFVRMANDVIKAVTGIDLIAVAAKWASGFIDGVVSAIKYVWNALPGVFTVIATGVKNAFIGLLSGITTVIVKFNLVSLLNAMIKKVFNIDLLGIGKKWFRGLVSGASEAIKGIPKMFADTFGDLTRAVMRFDIVGIGKGWLHALGNIASGIRNVFMGIVTFVPNLLNNAIKAITGVDVIGTVKAWLSPIADTVAGIFDTVKNVFADGVQFIKGFFLGELMGIKDSFSGGFLNGIRDVFTRLITLIPRLLNEALRAITGVDILQTGKDWIQKFIDGVLSVLKGAASLVKNAVKELLPESVLNFAGGAAKTIGGIAKAVGGAASSAAKGVIQTFGNGGIATEPSLVAEDGKPEMVIPLTKPKRAAELIRQLAPVLPDLEAAAPQLQIIREAAPVLPDLEAAAPKALPPLDGLMGKASSVTNNTSNIKGGSYNFSPTINVTGGGDPSTIKSAINEALSKAMAEFKRTIDRQDYNDRRVAMA